MIERVNLALRPSLLVAVEKEAACFVQKVLAEHPELSKPLHKPT